VLKSAPLIAGAIISTNAVAQNLFPQAKLTHEAANIRTIQKMGSNVRAASSKVVEDPVVASGWCQL